MITDTERAVFGEATVEQLRAFLDDWARDQLGSGIASVRFRAGRIDAVWGVELEDGRAVVIKLHRDRDPEPRRAAMAAQRILAAVGYPAPAPLAGPTATNGRLLSAESLAPGSAPDPSQPAVRRLLADGLHRHIVILSEHPEVVERAGSGPSWCRYQSGPWPASHDTLVDLSRTPPEYAWLDDFAQRASDQILTNRDPDRVIAAHGDWYAGNVTVADGEIVGTFDWELVADTEPVIAGFAASCFASSATGGGGLSGPGEIGAFLDDYAALRPFDERDRRCAQAAAAWILAFNARWQVGLIEHGIADQATIDLVRDHQQELLGDET